MPILVKNKNPFGDPDYSQLALKIKDWGRNLGFQQVGITDCDLAAHEMHLLNWLNADRHGEMAYMAKHGKKRSRPGELQPGTIRIISVSMNYLPENEADSEDVLHNDLMAFISRYALGRDYHKVIRRRLQKLADKIELVTGSFGYRAFVDSAPVLEKALAEKAGLGWIGKHTNLINKSSGSWFFLGELYTDLPLPIDIKAENHCGSCRSCIDICPTKAIVAPYQLDARRCISYLTIELKGSIPLELRPHIGNRIFGCDDCQLVCPWNKFSQISKDKDFMPRHELDRSQLTKLFLWSEEDFMQYTRGSAIRRIGYERWMRNIAVALGNTNKTDEVTSALNTQLNQISNLVDEHIIWALNQ